MLSSVHCCGYFFRVCLECMAFQMALLFLSRFRSQSFGSSSGFGGGGGVFSSTHADTRLRLTFAASFIPDIYAGTLFC